MTDREKLSLINAHSPWFIHPGYGSTLNTKRIQWLLNEFTNFEFSSATPFAPSGLLEWVSVYFRQSEQVYSRRASREYYRKAITP